MTDVSHSDDVVEIVMLTHRYAAAVDRFDPAALLSVFTEDAVVDFSAYGLPTLSGHDEIVTYFAESRASGRPSMHRISNHIVDVVDDTATGSHYTQALRPGSDGGQPSVAALALNEDRYVRCAGRWRIDRRIASPAIDIRFEF